MLLFVRVSFYLVLIWDKYLPHILLSIVQVDFNQPFQFLESSVCIVTNLKIMKIQ